MKALRILPLLGVLMALVVALTSVSAWTSGPSASAEYRLEYLIKSEHYHWCGRGHAIARYWRLKAPARWRAKDMVVRNYFSHTIKGTTHNVFYYFGRRYYVGSWSLAGEIIAWNTYSDAQSVTVAFQMWMKSYGHRAIIRNCRFTRLSVGSYKQGSKHMYVALFTRP